MATWGVTYRSSTLYCGVEMCGPGGVQTCCSILCCGGRAVGLMGFCGAPAPLSTVYCGVGECGTRWSTVYCDVEVVGLSGAEGVEPDPGYAGPAGLGPEDGRGH
jgi:hypothetical protein